MDHGRRRGLSLVALAVLLVGSGLLVGCGGGDDGAASGVTTTTDATGTTTLV